MNPQGNSKILTIAVVGLILTNILLLCFMFLKRPGHQGPPPDFNGPPQMGPGQRPPDRLIEELKFNDEQRKAFSVLRDEHRKIIRELMDKNGSFREDFFKQLSAGDEAVINSLSDSIAATQKKIELATFNHFKEVRKLCDEKQKNHFDQVIGDVLKMMGGPPHRGNP